jgi:medium-chain acyl-[acyl-carrier-protein] hydrolase
MGALIAYEVTRRLSTAGLPLPVHLFVSGHAAPCTADRRRRIGELPTEEFLGALRELNGFPATVLSDQALMRTLAPTLRDDFQLCESYRYTDSPPLTCPISAFGGETDDVSHEALLSWSRLTDGAFRLRMLAGDHFFVTTQRDRVIAAILHDLSLPNPVS